MDIEFKGGNCVVIHHKKDVVVVDPKISGIGLKDQGATASVQLLTDSRFGAPHSEDCLVIDGPGEYEVNNISIKGIPTRKGASEEVEVKTTTIYSLNSDGINMAIFGRITSKLNDEQLEAVGVIDVLILPVGGHGYTLDPKDAAALVREMSPKVVVPTHYGEEGVKYEVPQLPLSEFLKELGVAAEETPKLKLKSGQLPEVLTVYKITTSK